MERARVQGTDRVMMIQMTGRLIQDVIRRAQLGGEHHFLFALAAVLPDRLRGAGVPGRNALRLPGLFAEFRADHRRAGRWIICGSWAAAGKARKN